MFDLWRLAGIAFLITGLLEGMFAMLSCVGTGMGGLFTFVVPPQNPEEWWLGPVLFGAYGFFLVVTLISTTVHLAAGMHMVGPNPRNTKLAWAGTLVSILPAATVYCAPTSLVAGLLGLLALTIPQPGPPPAIDDDVGPLDPKNPFAS